MQDQPFEASPIGFLQPPNLPIPSLFQSRRLLTSCELQAYSYESTHESKGRWGAQAVIFPLPGKKSRLPLADPLPELIGHLRLGRRFAGPSPRYDLSQFLKETLGSPLRLRQLP